MSSSVWEMLSVPKIKRTQCLITHFYLSNARTIHPKPIAAKTNLPACLWTTRIPNYFVNLINHLSFNFEILNRIHRRGNEDMLSEFQNASRLSTYIKFSSNFLCFCMQCKWDVCVREVLWEHRAVWKHVELHTTHDITSFCTQWGNSRF